MIISPKLNKWVNNWVSLPKKKENDGVRKGVRMAERSKAPDSRWQYTFPLSNGSGRSGLQMEAWVRIPLLIAFFFSFFSLANYVFYLLSCCINDVVRFYLKLDSEIAIQSSLKGIIKTLRPRREIALLKWKGIYRGLASICLTFG